MCRVAVDTISMKKKNIITRRILISFSIYSTYKTKKKHTHNMVFRNISLRRRINRLLKHDATAGKLLRQIESQYFHRRNSRYIWREIPSRCMLPRILYYFSANNKPLFAGRFYTRRNKIAMFSKFSRSCLARMQSCSYVYIPITIHQQE